MKKLLAIVSLTALTTLIVLGGMATTAAAPALFANMTSAAAPTVSTPLTVTTTSQAYFVPLGYIRLACSTDVYYKVVSSSSGTVATTDSLARGPLSVNGVEVARPTWINITSNQWLALLLRSGVQGYCVIEQPSVDGLAGSFTTLSASSTLAVTGASTFASTAYIQGATTIDGALGSGGVISGTFDGGTARLGATSATSLDLPSSTQLTAIKFGSITLGGQSPSTGTATVLSGMKCNCTPETNTTDSATKCNVSSTTLTATGPNSSVGVINYLCVK